MSVNFRIDVFEEIFLSQIVQMEENNTVTFCQKTFRGGIPKAGR